MKKRKAIQNMNAEELIDFMKAINNSIGENIFDKTYIDKAEEQMDSEPAIFKYMTPEERIIFNSLK